jgi:hypothetical protein
MFTSKSPVDDRSLPGEATSSASEGDTPACAPETASTKTVGQDRAALPSAMELILRGQQSRASKLIEAGLEAGGDRTGTADAGPRMTHTHWSTPGNTRLG